MISFNIDEAAAFLKMHPQTLCRKAKNGEVPARKVGRRWVFIREHLADFVSGRYGNQAKGLRLLDGGKSQRETTTWESTNEKAVKSIGLISATQVESEYANLLGLKTNAKRKNCTTA